MAVVPPASIETASASERFSGAGAILSGLIATYSAALPNVRPSTPHTRRPAVTSSTEAPVSTTSPTKSMPRRCGNRRPVTRRTLPARPASSPPLTLTARTRTRTSSRSISGTGTDPT